ncbi:MAG TPA: Crp/Fnr family transcriptional regulator [Terriglobia bacterium]|nr:Crp/Fnr family transcriptional regulator [Terriglobia bacterium]
MKDNQIPIRKSRDFFKNVGAQKTTREYRNQQDIYLQGDTADSMFNIQQGNVRLTVEGKRGKKAVVAILGRGDSFGEGCLVKQSRRWSTATTIQPSIIVRLKRETLVRFIRQDPAFAERFISFLVSRVGRIQEDLVGLLFNSSEKRLARVLLSLDHFGKEGELESVIPHINQQTLAEMIGTTRSRVSHFMNRFRKLGLVEYNGSGLTIHGGLLSAALQD